MPLLLLWGLAAQCPHPHHQRLLRLVKCLHLIQWCRPRLLLLALARQGLRERLELGPRALGNRSILCDPTRFDMREIINTKVKFRESFRPFAPSVIEQSMDSHFICGPRVPADDYMLLVYKTAEREHMRIPAVVQEDEFHHVSTSRVQTVNRERNPAYHRLIEEF